MITYKSCQQSPMLTNPIMTTHPSISGGQELGLTSSTESLNEGTEAQEAHSSGGWHIKSTIDPRNQV